MSFSFFNLKKPAVIGILNVTPDSFYDGGKYTCVHDALRRALEMENDGAQMIDIGAVSTRPGSEIADEETEAERLLPAVKLILSEVHIPVSVDTFRPAIAKAVLDCGVAVINDVSGCYNEKLASLVCEYSAGWILTHTGGKNVGAGEQVQYENGVVPCVQEFFDQAVQIAQSFRIHPEQLCLDPGFGFSKNSGENLQLLESLNLIDTHGCVMMCALSRKRFIKDYALLLGHDDILEGTLAADKFAFAQGASLFRVHDVAEHIYMFNNIIKESEGE